VITSCHLPPNGPASLLPALPPGPGSRQPLCGGRRVRAVGSRSLKDLTVICEGYNAVSSVLSLVG
jgi:hypothetical protein